MYGANNECVRSCTVCCTRQSKLQKVCEVLTRSIVWFPIFVGTESAAACACPANNKSERNESQNIDSMIVIEEVNLPLTLTAKWRPQRALITVTVFFDALSTKCSKSRLR